MPNAWPYTPDPLPRWIPLMLTVELPCETESLPFMVSPVFFT